MSQENVEIVQRVFEAAARHEPAAVLALYDPEIEFDTSRVSWGDVTGQGVHHGHEGLRRAFRDWYEAWEDYVANFDELIDAGDHVVSLGTGRARGRASGAEVEQTAGGVWTLRDGKIVRLVWFPTRGEALEAAGLSE